MFLRDFCVISLGVSKDLVHELPRSPARASTPHSVVFQGSGAPRDSATLLLAQYTGLLRGPSDQSHYSPVVTRMRLSRCGFYLFIFSSEDGSVSCILYLVFFPSKSEKDIFLSLKTFLVLHFALGISSRCLRLRRKLLVRSSRGR
jgi:hypothetical protein